METDAQCLQKAVVKEKLYIIQLCKMYAKNREHVLTICMGIIILKKEAYEGAGTLFETG